METSLLKELEAILFLAGRRVSWQDLADILKLKKKDVRKIVEELRGIYEKRDGAITIDIDDYGAFMTVRKEFSDKYWFLAKAELGRGEMKTLAFVAYYAPVKQSDVVKARGNRAYEHIRKLEALGFIRSEKKGNTKILYITNKFKEYFGDVDAIRNRALQTIEKRRS